MLVVVGLRWMEGLVCLGRKTDRLRSETQTEHWRRRKAELTCQDGDRDRTGPEKKLNSQKKKNKSTTAFRRVVAVGAPNAGS